MGRTLFTVTKATWTKTSDLRKMTKEKIPAIPSIDLEKLKISLEEKEKLYDGLTKTGFFYLSGKERSREFFLSYNKVPYLI